MAFKGLALSVMQLFLATAAMVVSVLLALDEIRAQKAAVLLLSLSGLYMVFKLHELTEAVQTQSEWLWDFNDGLYQKSDSMERRIMQLAFSPYECARQIQNGVSEWDVSVDPYFGSRQCFQYCGRYARNFMQRTGHPVTSDHLSALINFAISNVERIQDDITMLKDQLRAGWHVELHGQPPQGYNENMTVQILMANTQAMPVSPSALYLQAEFYALTSE